MNMGQLNQFILNLCASAGFPADVRHIFTQLKSNHDVADFIKDKKSATQNIGNDLLYDLIASAYNERLKNFTPIFKYQVNDRLFDTNAPRLCLGLHSLFSPLSAILVQKNLKFAVVSSFPQAVEKVAFVSGIASAQFHMISRDETCLVNSKKLLQKNYLVSSTIDFRRKVPGPFDRLSDSMIRLAYYVRPYAFFGLNCVNDEGEMIYITQDIDLGGTMADVQKNIVGFIYKFKKSRYEFAKFNFHDNEKMLKPRTSGS